MLGWPSCNSPLTQRSEAFRRHIRVRFSLSGIGVRAKRVEELCELRRTAVKPAAVHHIALAIAVIGDPTQAAKDAKQADLVNHLQNAKTRRITVEERSEIAEAVKENELPAIDLVLRVRFRHDHAGGFADSQEAWGGAQRRQAQRLGVPRRRPYRRQRSAAYNLGLSDARAKSVREFLIEKFHLDPKQLVAIGFGEEQLKNKDDPLAAKNRRVQVVNMASQDVAAKGGVNAP
jgi:OmpA family